MTDGITLGGGSAVRCGFCPGASAAVVRVARTPCARCRARLAQEQGTCPNCDGALLVDPDAEDGTGARRVVIFCTGCEFTHPVDGGGEAGGEHT
jgi:hypothetical protein